MWFWIAIVLGAAVMALVLWLRSRNIKVAWYEWLIGVIGFLLLMFTIQTYTAVIFVEGEPRNSWYFLLMFGLPALILLAVAWQLVTRRHRAGA